MHFQRAEGDVTRKGQPPPLPRKNTTKKPQEEVKTQRAQAGEIERHVTISARL